jgi:hypothetical protein
MGPFARPGPCFSTIASDSISPKWSALTVN